MQNAFVDGERVWERAHRPRLSAFANAPDGGAQALEVDPQTGGARWAADGGWRRRWVDVHLAASVFWRWLSWWPEKGQQCDYLDGSCAALACVPPVPLSGSLLSLTSFAPLSAGF